MRVRSFLGVEGVFNLMIDNIKHIELRINNKFSGKVDLFPSDLYIQESYDSFGLKCTKEIKITANRTGSVSMVVVDFKGRDLVKIDGGNVLAGDTINISGSLVTLSSIK